jgi:hypothetical protein
MSASAVGVKTSVPLDCPSRPVRRMSRPHGPRICVPAGPAHNRSLHGLAPRPYYRSPWSHSTIEGATNQPDLGRSREERSGGLTERRNVERPSNDSGLARASTVLRAARRAMTEPVPQAGSLAATASPPPDAASTAKRMSHRVRAAPAMRLSETLRLVGSPAVIADQPGVPPWNELGCDAEPTTRARRCLPRARLVPASKRPGAVALVTGQASARALRSLPAWTNLSSAAGRRPRARSAARAATCKPIN